MILGVGGYGRVYKGVWRPANGEPIAVAIKELLEDGEEYQQLFQGFQLEAYIMSNLSHPNIVKLYVELVSFVVSKRLLFDLSLFIVLLYFL